jgi:hypothetical protein
VACSTNTIGVQGEFFTYTDDAGSSITLSATGEDVCLEGTAGLMDASTWGAGVGFNVNQTESGEDPNQWDAEAMNISGFRFTLSALPVSGMRLVYQTDGIDYCVPLTSPGMQTVMFDETAEECWATGGGPPDPSTLEAIKWQVTTDSAGEHDFDFCITGLAAIP